MTQMGKLLCLIGMHDWEGRYHSPWSWNGGCYAYVCKRCDKVKPGTCRCAVCYGETAGKALEGGGSDG